MAMNGKGTNVIYSEDESMVQQMPMYWSNEFGWVELGMATKFTDRDKERLNLPIGGEWEDLFEAMKNDRS